VARLAVIVASFALSGLVAASWMLRVESASHDGKVMRFAYVGSADDARHLSALRFKERIERESGGTLAVELFPGGQLGGDRDAIEGVRLGTIEMTVAGAGLFANFEPSFGVTALPYLFNDFDEAWAFNDGPIGAALARRLERQNLRLLGNWDNGFRCLTNSVRPVESLDDLRSLSIRTPENPILLATLEALDARPSPLPWPELYMALQQGAYDGQENPIPTICVSRLYEVQTYLSVTNHCYEPMPLVMNETFWRSLTDGERRIVKSAARESQRFNRELVRRRTDEMLIELKRSGMIVSFPDTRPFEAATWTVHDRFASMIGPELIATAQAFVRTFRETRRQAPPIQDRE